MNFDIPVGLTDLLQEFTVAVLRERPPDLVTFAANYFNKLNDSRTCYNLEQKSSVRFVASPSSDELDHNDQDLDEDFEPPPASSLFRRKSVSAEAYNPESDDEDESEPKVVNPKSDKQRQRLGDVVKDIILFRTLDPEQMQEVLDAMFEKKLVPGDHIIDQGDDGDNFYVIDAGTYDIYVKVDGMPKLVGNYDNSGFFGELALMYNMPRAATIVASSPGTIWALDRTTFRRIVLKSAFEKRKKYESLLESVPLLKSLDEYERMNVADALLPRTYKDGEQIIRQGDSADVMYFVEEGKVRIAVVNMEDSDQLSEIKLHADSEVEADLSEGEKNLAFIEKGGYFGELALVTHQPRAASAYAEGAVRCAVLDVHAFERLMGPCMNIMKRNISDYEEQLSNIFGKSVSVNDS